MVPACRGVIHRQRTPESKRKTLASVGDHDVMSKKIQMDRMKIIRLGRVIRWG